MRGWTPVRLHPRPGDMGGWMVDWVWSEGLEFDDPFFDMTVERGLRNPFRLLVRRETTLAQLDQDAGERARDPDGLVFHVSRCGSTLLANGLRARDRTSVLAEPGPVETVVAAPFDDDLRVSSLRAVLRALAPDDPGRAHVVKLDAWSALDFPVFLRAFPEVPWVFVVRDPREVMVSQVARRGFHVIPGALRPERVGLEAAQLPTMGLDEYGAAVIGRILQCGHRAVTAAGDQAMVLDHGELEPGVVVRVAAHFGLDLDAADLGRVRACFDVHAKNPVLPYEDDRARKRDAVDDALAVACERWALPAYRAVLEDRRGDA